MLLADSGNLAVMTLLELSAAFDSVDHTTLLRQLQTSYGLCGTVLNWFTSYLTGRTQYDGIQLCFVCRSILCVLYTADLLSLIQSHGLTPHAYVDDTQPSETDILQLLGRRFSMHSDKETAVGPE